MESKAVNSRLKHTTNARYWVGLLIAYLIIPLVLWTCAGDLAWWQAWVYSGIILMAGVGMRARANQLHPGLIDERAKFGRAPGTKAWDKVLSPLMALSVGYPLFIVAGLDHRFGWSDGFPWGLNLVGFILCVLSYSLAGWALIENRFFASTVRIQTEREHVVCDSGPYRFVRHPGYAGNILALPGVVLALGSLWVIVPAGVALVIAVVRTELEDRTLQAELPGYQEYSQRVRYKLLPGVY